MATDTTNTQASNLLREHAIGYGSRFMIYTIDGGVVLASFVPAFVISLFTISSVPWVSHSVVALWFLTTILYLTVLKISRYGTIGYKAMGVKIVTAHGGRPSILKMVVRLITPLLFPETIILDLHWFGRGETRQTLADRLAGTYVVKQSIPSEIRGPSRYTLDCFGGLTVASEE